MASLPLLFFEREKTHTNITNHERKSTKKFLISTDIVYNKQTIKMTTTTTTTTTTKRTYSNPLVRIGNWREDEALELVGFIYLVSSRHIALLVLVVVVL